MKVDISKKVLGIYIILSVILTYPAVFNIDKIPGTAGDNYQFLWFLWWFKKSLLGLSSPYYTTYIFYPTGTNLAFSTLTPFNSILSIPLQLTVGLIYSYNILYLLSFIISGFGMYLLAKYLIKDTRASFIAGLIFMFSPYHFIQADAGHLNLIAIEWVPFYILYLFKIFNEDKIKNSLYGAIFLLLVGLSEYQYLIFMLFFSIIFLLYYINKLKLDTVKRLFLLIIIFMILFFPFVYPILKEILSHSNYMYAGNSENFSSDLLGYFVPNRFNIFLKNLPTKFVGESIGYTVLFLSLISILKIKTRETSREVRFWTFSTIIFFIFSLGPKLHIDGKIVDFIPLPYYIITKIPIISIMRVPKRWDLLVILSLAIISGYGLNYLFKEYKFEKLKTNINFNNLILVIISTLIIFEYLAIPVNTTDVKIPKIYYQLRNDSDNYSILELPATQTWFNAHYMYYQTFHEKKLVNGYVSRETPNVKIFAKYKFINQLYFTKNGSMTNNMIIQGKKILNNNNIRYIILHEKDMNKNQIEIANNLLKNISTIKIYKEDKLIVYKIDEI